MGLVSLRRNLRRMKEPKYVVNGSGAITGLLSPTGVTLAIGGGGASSLTTEALAGTKNGVNADFTISIDATYCAIFLNGVRLKLGVGYARAGLNITMQPGYIPVSGDTLE